jgi:hypothetical protein
MSCAMTTDDDIILDTAAPNLVVFSLCIAWVQYHKKSQGKGIWEAALSWMIAGDAMWWRIRRSDWTIRRHTHVAKVFEAKDSKILRMILGARNQQVPRYSYKSSDRSVVHYILRNSELTFRTVYPDPRCNCKINGRRDTQIQVYLLWKRGWKINSFC